MDNKALPWTIVILLTSCILVCLCGGVLLGVFLWDSGQEPTGLGISVDSPVQASLGEDILITVTIENTSDSSKELNSIDIDDSFLEGIVINQVEPIYDEVDSYDLFDYTFTSYYFYRSIRPGETLVVTFYGRSIQAGDFSGDLDVCIDSTSRCKDFLLRTVIR